MNSIISKLVKKKDADIVAIDFIPDWKGEGLFLRKMSGRNMLQYISKDEKDLNTLKSYVDCVSMCVVGKDGKMVFNDDDGREYLEDMPFAYLSELFKKATKTVTLQELEDVKKK